MRSLNIQTTFFHGLLLFAIIQTGCTQKSSVNPKYDIAPTTYEELTEKYLLHLANFELEESYSSLADNVVFRLPDGDANTRTTFKGLDEVKNFWDNYQKESGNDKAVFKNFVHLPVQVNQKIEHVDATGIFDICYFSAELSYGSEVAHVRMNWTFHFNEENKIDGIYTYYDRTPIIKAAKKNFLAKNDNNEAKGTEEMIVQVVKLKTALSEEELITKAKERAPRFREFSGLLQKYYVRLGEPDQYAGVYIWDSKKSLSAYKESDLAATIGEAYKVVDAPNIEIGEVLFTLRE